MFDTDDHIFTPGAWRLSRRGAFASFQVNNFIFGTVVGVVPVLSVEVAVTATGSPATIDAELDPSGIDTGNPQRDERLRSRHFLDVDTYPVVTFASSAIAPARSGWTVEGDLRIRATAQPIVLDVSRISSPLTGLANLRATARVDRRRAGLGNVPRFMIGRLAQIELDLALEHHSLIRERLLGGTDDAA
jgi:polyisoprenoid-binding protein YceI